jgi:fructosamine-3-kinase
VTGGLPDELVDGLDVRAVTPVHGGDIARSFRLDTASGPLFAKTHPSPPPALFEREAAGLTALRASATVAVPEVVRATSSGLVLAWIEVGGGRDRRTEGAFGSELASLHRTTGPHFGGLDAAPAGYLGSQPVDLTPTDRWSDFFVERRLRPLSRRAVELGRLDRRALDLVERAAARADELCGPPEPPALLHGDLWAGNRLVDRSGRNWVIDPAAHWGHREIDLAMMRLFGGFGDVAFAAYDEAFPLTDGWPDRVSWYQLPPLLVHAILFGGGYGAAALAALEDAVTTS